jgi:ATPase subunit of ABC transporter with duplicated ATPase domains
VGFLEVSHLSYVLPDGRPLLHDVSFRVGEGHKVALVGANGAGKTTLVRCISGDARPTEGTVSVDGRLGVMRQFIGSVRDDSTVRDFLLSLAPQRVQDAAAEVEKAELALMESDDEPAQLRYANALVAWGDAGGYEAEVFWDTCCMEAFGLSLDDVKYRDVRTLSGGEQKKLALQTLLRSDADVLLLDEPDNYLDVPAKEWLEQALAATPKTVLFISHDRELLARTATQIVTVEGGSAWVHGGGFATYHDARENRLSRLEELRRRWDEEHDRLQDLVRTLRQQAANSDAMASRYHAMQTRLRKFEEAGPPIERPREQKVAMRLGGGRTGVRALVVEDLELTGLTKPWSTEVFYGERVGVLGPNGTGKSHFLRLLAGDGSVRSTGEARLGARVVAGHFAQTHHHPELMDRTLRDILWEDHALQRGTAMGRLRRYELDGQSEQTFDSLSGGQQARFQILLLELAGVTMLLLDEPTDNLDLASAEALEEALAAFDGTVLAVTHDRWFMRSFDRFLVFGDDGEVRTSDVPVW